MSLRGRSRVLALQRARCRRPMEMLLNITEMILVPISAHAVNVSLAATSSTASASALADATGTLAGYSFPMNMNDTDGEAAPDRGEQSMRTVGSSFEDSQLVSKHVMDKTTIIFVMILIPSFSVFGSVGNILSLRVLVHHRMRNATNMVLAALAVSDLLFLFHAFYFSFLKFLLQRNPPAGEYLSRDQVDQDDAGGGHDPPAHDLGLHGEVDGHQPLGAQHGCQAVVFIPMALKYYGFCKTINNQTIYGMGLTELGHNTVFYLVYGNVLNVLFRLIPILVLILVNILIACAIHKTWSIRRSMSNGSSATYEQNRITLMLLMVSLVFLVCILPGAIHSIVNQMYKQYSRQGSQSNIYDVMGSVTYFLETVNSSVNFVIYMAFSTKFCRTYKQIFCCSGRRSINRNSARSVIRFSSRPQMGSRSSMTSYRELYFLNQLGKGKISSFAEREINGKPVRKNGFVNGTGSIVEEGGKKIFRSKYSISESYSGHSHSGQSSQGKLDSSKGERYSQQSAHSSHSAEPTAEDMYS
uniref:G-protein coupled receptors family 1 profile domain-containing protein n=1 Tax=Biomphalaria glabrata TaxID=6526 RepID=A0A2C9LE19_BIOGL